MRRNLAVGRALRLGGAMLCGLLCHAAAAASGTIVLLGDMPYGPAARVYVPYAALIGTINNTGPDLVIHLGDTKASDIPCSDAMQDDQLAFMMRVTAPLLYTPGDNEWADCHAPAAGGHDPLERLDRLRARYFAEPGRSLGAAAVAVAHQGDAGYPENVRLALGDLLVLTVHVVGTPRNRLPDDPAALREHRAREASNLDWLREGFAVATRDGAAAVLVAFHSDIFGRGFGETDSEDWVAEAASRPLGRALARLAAEFGGPVLVAHGDGHVLTYRRPLPTAAPQVVEVEVPGADAMHAVRVDFDTETPRIFTVRLLPNPALLR